MEAGQDGTFEANVPLSEGENKIKAQAIDQAGNVSKFSKLVVITYQPPPPSEEVEPEQSPQPEPEQQQPEQQEEPQPKTLKERVTELAIEVWGDKTNMGKSRVGEVSIGDDNAVGIEFNAGENLTTGLTKLGIQIDMKELLQEIFKVDSSIPEVILSAFLPLVDVYGNETDGKVMIVWMSLATEKKINWENFLYKNFPIVADDYWEHPIFNK